MFLLKGLNKMSIEKNTTKQVHIEKYDIGTFEKEKKPYAMILTEVTQNFPMSHAQEYLLWSYLESLPPNWIPNRYHLMQKFNISSRTYERYMSFLSAVGLIEYRQVRQKNGAFGKGHLVVLDGLKFNPQAINNGTVKIDGSVINKKKAKNRTAKFGDTGQTSKPPYNTSEYEESPNRQITEPRQNAIHINTKENTINKINKTTNCESSSSLEIPSFNHNQALNEFDGSKVIVLSEINQMSDYQNNYGNENLSVFQQLEEYQGDGEVVFSKSIDEKILNQKLKRDNRTDNEFLKICKDHVDNHSDKKYPFVKRAYALIKLLKKLNMDNVVFCLKEDAPPQEKSNEENKSPFTQEEIFLAQEYLHFKKNESFGGISVEKAIPNEEKRRIAVDILQKMNSMEIQDKCQPHLNVRRSCLNSASSLVSHLL